MNSPVLQPSAADTVQTSSLADHVLAISDDGNIGEAIALVPELEAIIEHARAGITEADVVAFLVRKASELANAAGDPYAIVGVQVLNACYRDQPRPEWKTYVNGDTHRTADTLAGAFNASVAAMSPTVRARELREKAAAMLAEAANLAPVETVADADMRVVVRNETSHGQASGVMTLADFVRNTEDDSFDLSAIAAELRRTGSFTWNGGVGDVFTLRPEVAS